MIDRTTLTSAALALLTLGYPVALGGCPGEAGSGDPAEQVEPIELPPMSVGTLRAMGPHRYTATLTITRPGQAPSTERHEVVWGDLEHFRARQWVDDVPQVDEFRDGDLYVKSQGEGDYQLRTPRSGTDVLLRTLTPFDITIGRFEHDLEVRDAGAMIEPPDTRRYLLALASAEADGSFADPEARALRMLDDGHSALPTALEGEVVVDGLGNRRSVTLTGTYHKRASGRFAQDATEVALQVRREPLGPEEQLVAPVGAAVLIAEQRGAQQTEQDQE